MCRKELKLLCVCALCVTFPREKKLQLYEQKLWKCCSLNIDIMLIVMKQILINPRLWARCARPRAHPAYLAQFNPTLFFQSFLSLHCWCSLLLPGTYSATRRAFLSLSKHWVPALVKILPFSFAFLLLFLIFTLSLQRSPPLECRGTFPNPGEEKIMHCLSLCCHRDSRTAK